MGRAAVALAAASALGSSPALAQSAAPLELQFDPSLKFMQVAAESLAQNTQGRYGIMGMDFRLRTNFVYSEGGFFDCGSFPMLPAACAFWLSESPAGAILGFAPDSLVRDSWAGDSASTLALAARLGSATLEKWLSSGGMLGTTLTDNPSGLPYTSTVWDCMVMLAVIEARLGGSHIPPVEGGSRGSILAGCALPGTVSWGLVSFAPGSCRAALAAHLPDGRRLGLVFFADSLESESLAVERLGLLAAILHSSTLHPPGFPE